jgi:ATP-dependent protease ClpP protease subunit
MNKIMQIYRDNAQRPKQFTDLVNVAGDSATIYLYDMISADWGVSALSVIEAIAQAGDAKILNVHINSPGGDVFEGRAIKAALSVFKGKTVARIDSLCASAATSIALACDEVVMADGAFFMIHNASGMAWGDKQTLRDTADVLEKVESAIVRDYVQKTGKEESEIRALMDAETWFTANEAMEHGFVDALDKGKKATNTWNLSAFAKAPKMEVIPDRSPEVFDTSTHEPAQAGFLMSSANANRLRILKIA